MGANDRAIDAKRDAAKSKGKPKEKQLTLDGMNAAFVGFVNVDLTDDDKKTFSKWVEQVSFGEALQLHIDDGCVISIKVDQRSGGYSAAATQRRESSVNAGLCINMRAGEPVRALQRLIFVLSAVVGGDWKLYAASGEDDDW